MIVNPQEFNYRVTLASLIIVIAAVAAFGLVNYNDLKSDADFLKQEKKLLHQELSTFIDRYDELGSENETIREEHQQAVQRAELALDSLQAMKANVAILSHVQAELNFLRRQSRNWRSDSLELLVEDLREDKEQMSRALIRETIQSDQLRTQNEHLTELIKAGNLIYANSFRAVARKKGKEDVFSETDKANKAEHMEVCFVIGQNPLASSGKKDIYIQIVGPDNNVINDMGAVNFGDLSLIYSSKLELDYNNDNLEVCELIPGSEAFKKGLYYISVFENERRLGGTRLELQ